jgi:uncharacterized protein (TIGR03067 family)
MFLLNISCALGLIAVVTSLAMVQQETAAATGGEKSLSAETLVGRYRIVSGEKNGETEPEERIKGTTVTWAKESVVVADKETKEIYSASYKLDTSTNPAGITMMSRVKSSSGEVVQGLIQKEGATVTLIYALPTGETPASFKTKQKQLMFVMEKID